MTKEQTRTAMEACVRAAYWGATRRPRMAWILGQTGLGVAECSQFISLLLKAHMLEDHYGYGWISATPFLISVIDNFDSLTQDITWTDDVTTDDDPNDREDEPGGDDEGASQDNG